MKLYQVVSMKNNEVKMKNIIKLEDLKMESTIRVTVAKIINNDMFTSDEKQSKLLDVTLLLLDRDDVTTKTRDIVDNWYKAFKAYNILKNI